MSDKDTDFQKIKKLIKIMKDNDLAEIEIKRDDEKIHLKANQPQVSSVAMPQVVLGNVPAVAGGAQAGSQTPDVAAEKQDDLEEIKSPIVGTFYATPTPDSDAFVEVGSAVSNQMVVCIIEAMKVMNEIKSEISGTIAEICVASGQAVEYGQVLFKVKPN
jgi:acetyl-CoA carboxylase biotin carboxyl carrier protein